MVQLCGHGVLSQVQWTKFLSICEEMKTIVVYLAQFSSRRPKYNIVFSLLKFKNTATYALCYK